MNKEQSEKLKIRIQDIIEECVYININDVPEHLVGLDLTWIDKEIRKIKDRLMNKFMDGKENGN